MKSSLACKGIRDNHSSRPRNFKGALIVGFSETFDSSILERFFDPWPRACRTVRMSGVTRMIGPGLAVRMPLAAWDAFVSLSPSGPSILNGKPGLCVGPEVTSESVT